RRDRAGHGDLPVGRNGTAGQLATSTKGRVDSCPRGGAQCGRLMARIRLGLVDASHLHFRGLIKAALECPTAEVVGMAIEDREQRAYYAAAHPSVPAFATAEELYDRGRPQAILTCADNRRAAEVVADAAARGLHVMKEKPMAATLGLADQMATAATRAGVRLMINWPTNWSPAYHHAKRLIDDGCIGSVWQVHHRA